MIDEKQNIKTIKETIKETKCTCTACKNVWFYGKEEETKKKMNNLHNASRAMFCCSGCFIPALLMGEKEIIDLNKCPKCGSKAVHKEIVIHQVYV